MREMLETMWEVLTFQPLYGPTGNVDIVIGILVWILLILLIGALGYLVWLLSYTVYRVIAYDYEVETMPATVTDKNYRPPHTTWTTTGKVMTPIHHSAEYYVDIVSDSNLDDVINSKELYDWAQKGSRLWVAMKIGRSRKANREIKYWRVTDYTWN